jgi:SHS2 domain-containing protein
VFEILEHPADIGFRVRAATLPELFAEAAQALVAIAFEPGDVAMRETYALEARGEDNESLLVNWLSEVLWLLDGPKLAMREFRVISLAPGRVIGGALGEPRDPARHRAKLIVKGVTYHQLKVFQDRDGWCAEVFLDV